MTDFQKERITSMRSNGVGYGQIASTLGISINSVKSYCQRNQLGGQRSPDISAACDDKKYCIQCSKEFVPNKVKKAQRFCSDVCRMVWWKGHPEQLQRKTFYQFTCNTCQKSFVSYGNNKRKFCSHACYILSRFRGGSDE